MKYDIVAVVPAAGKGTRAGQGQNKLLAPLYGVPVLERTLTALSLSPQIQKIFVVVSPEDQAQVQSICDRIATPTEIVFGGATRTESVKNALAKIGDAEIVVIHDGARPYVTPELIARCVNTAKENGSAIAALPATDTISVVSDDKIIQTPDRNALVCIQTPQTFVFSQIAHAYAQVTESDVFTDDAGVYGAYIGNPHIVEGARDNVKITYAEDYALCGKYFCGTGFDVHGLVENRPLILGGVDIPHEKGLLGHSDADALTHAVMDALLSAAALGDIGKHFPDTDPAYKNADSIKLLKRVVAMLHEKGYAVWNVSATIMAQKPKLAPFIPQMQSNLAAACGIAVERVGVGATTTEKLGFIGREEGIGAHANVLIVKEK